MVSDCHRSASRPETFDVTSGGGGCWKRQKSVLVGCGRRHADCMFGTRHEMAATDATAADD